MVDFSTMDLGEYLDARDRDRLWKVMSPICDKAKEIEESMPKFLFTLVAMPTMKCGAFQFQIDLAKDALDQLAMLQVEAQKVVTAFVPEFPTRNIFAGGDGK